MLKGHDRAITSITLNYDGDLFFSTSKGPTITLWYSCDGVRLGTYSGHKGTVWSVDPSRDSKRLLSASADNFVKLWELETGRELFTWDAKVPMRFVQHAEGEKMFLAVTDNVLGKMPSILIHKLDRDLSKLEAQPMKVLEMKEGKYKILGAHWGPLNETIFSCDESGLITVWDVETGKVKHVIDEHSAAVKHLHFTRDRGAFLSSSSDHTARLFDSRTYKCMKVYETGRPINDAALHPTMDHIALAGGQSARDVTQKSNDPMQFATRVHHSIFLEEIACIPGHFGPVNALDYSPDGKVLITGGEDGYIRLNFLEDEYNVALSDKEYFSKKMDRL